jgi:hypothetical protein
MLGDPEKLVPHHSLRLRAPRRAAIIECCRVGEIPPPQAHTDVPPPPSRCPTGSSSAPSTLSSTISTPYRVPHRRGRQCAVTALGCVLVRRWLGRPSQLWRWGGPVELGHGPVLAHWRI